MAFSTGTLKSVVENGTVTGWDAAAGGYGHSIVDMVMVPVFRMALGVINLATSVSPVDYLSSGRSITWVTLATTVGQVVFLLGGVFAVWGIVMFSRRELAQAQAQSQG